MGRWCAVRPLLLVSVFRLHIFRLKLSIALDSLKVDFVLFFFLDSKRSGIVLQ